MSIRVRVNAVHPEDAAIRQAAEIMAAGGVVAFPTETLYGLGADATDTRSVERVFALKGRDRAVAIPLIAADRAQVITWVAPLDATAARLADHFWPGPLTLVLPAGDQLPRSLLAGGTTVAVRVSAHPVAAALARALGRPITATSANRSGQPPTALVDEVDAALGGAVDLVVDAGACPGGPPSTIVDLTGSAPRLVRDGAVPWERVLEFLRK
jgi:L-threonylcarbamoyladenylate synthase